MVMEGVDVRALDREMKRFGMPMGPLELIDHVGIDVSCHVADTLKSVLPESDSVVNLLRQMLARGWTGRKDNCGFYVYQNGKRGAVNSRVADVVRVLHESRNRNQSSGVKSDSTSRTSSGPTSDSTPSTVGAFVDDGLTEYQRRLLYPMINEIGFCLQERVVSEPWMADLAMVLGTGFAPFLGGPLTLASDIGTSTLVNNLRVLRTRHGERFKPSAWLADRRDMVSESAACFEWEEMR